MKRTLCFYTLTHERFSSKSKGLVLAKKLKLDKAKTKKARSKTKGGVVDVIQESIDSIGAEDTLKSIINFDSMEEGKLYEAWLVNEMIDRETGHLDDYDFEMIETERDSVLFTQPYAQAEVDSISALFGESDTPRPNKSEEAAECSSSTCPEPPTNPTPRPSLRRYLQTKPRP